MERGSVLRRSGGGRSHFPVDAKGRPLSKIKKITHDTTGHTTHNPHEATHTRHTTHGRYTRNTYKLVKDHYFNQKNTTGDVARIAEPPFQKDHLASYDQYGHTLSPPAPCIFWYFLHLLAFSRTAQRTESIASPPNTTHKIQRSIQLTNASRAPPHPSPPHTTASSPAAAFTALRRRPPPSTPLHGRGRAPCTRSRQIQ